MDKKRRVVFRTDASLDIGTGHVMRCLTLADALRLRGVESHFLCREHPGHLNELIHQKGYAVHALAFENRDTQKTGKGLAHAHWLGTTQVDDAQACHKVLQQLQPDWLIVDHYALDCHWQGLVREYCGQLMVIDDLADRVHLCDLLLDQNLGKTLSDYDGLLPLGCITLFGPRHALLRPEFAELRDDSIARRTHEKCRRLLINMGGVDLPNSTGKILGALKICSLPANCRVDVVLGARSPWIEEVREVASRLPWEIDVAVGVSDMAKRMSKADMAIGAAGGTSWERCCLGLPALLIVIADNQWGGARKLHDHGAGILVGGLDDIEINLSHCLDQAMQDIHHLGSCASRITDGLGANMVSDHLLGNGDEFNSIH